MVSAQVFRTCVLFFRACGTAPAVKAPHPRTPLNSPAFAPALQASHMRTRKCGQILRACAPALASHFSASAQQILAPAKAHLRVSSASAKPAQHPPFRICAPGFAPAGLQMRPITHTCATCPAQYCSHLCTPHAHQRPRTCDSFFRRCENSSSNSFSCIF